MCSSDLGMDSMNVMMTRLGCSKQGQLDDAATQGRFGGDLKYMSTKCLLMKKIDTSMDKYGSKVVPQVQVLQVKKFGLRSGEVTLLGKRCQGEVSNHKKVKDTHLRAQLELSNGVDGFSN